MKLCPACLKSYSEETLSFCLADGAALSERFGARKEDPQATLKIRAADYGAARTQRRARLVIPLTPPSHLPEKGSAGLLAKLRVVLKGWLELIGYGE